MHTARRTFVATVLAGLLAALGVTAAIATGATPDGPPRIAFLANGRVPADALAAGPIAGQLGAPLYTTEKGTLVDSTANALDAYDPELVIVLGGTAAISDAVVDQVATATGLAVTSDASPTGGIVRAAGGDRFATATAVADLLAAYDPAYLPVGAQAIDADTLDGREASAFQPAGDYLPADGKADTAGHADTAGDADTLDGKDAGHFGTAFGSADVAASIAADGTVEFSNEEIASVTYDAFLNRYTITFDAYSFSDQTDIAVVTPRISPSGPTAASSAYTSIGSELQVSLWNSNGNPIEAPFTFVIFDSVG